ncbi:hypothetical protein DPEC_G00096570 [Dallia pectoralis]|uniref:Uncharacterized protein n=1 Tax=Dallia pectoralis TaxID=75939 RepID=A0ACC2GW22_DALPE|nr:hypothetical protein DPEC_G00096570 [Dallia pectoralis]
MLIGEFLTLQEQNLPNLTVNHMRRWIISDARKAFLKKFPEVAEGKDIHLIELATTEDHQRLIIEPKPSVHANQRVDALCGLPVKQALPEIQTSCTRTNKAEILTQMRPTVSFNKATKEGDNRPYCINIPVKRDHQGGNYTAAMAAVAQHFGLHAP